MMSELVASLTVHTPLYCTALYYNAFNCVCWTCWQPVLVYVAFVQFETANFLAQNYLLQSVNEFALLTRF